MVAISTRSGDEGTTGLHHGGRVSKADPIIECLGDVDETQAILGVARAGCAEAGTAALLLTLQRDLGVLAADLATPREGRPRLIDGSSRVTPHMVSALEEVLDRLLAERPLRAGFAIPGATPTSAALDHGRTVARRAERHVVAAREGGRHVSDDVVRYLNRLSDVLFVLARHAAGDADDDAGKDPRD